jgi:integrative and conjugative element protein (TIGR02256 family)
MDAITMGPVVVATLPTSSQLIILQKGVLEYLAEHRQTQLWKPEAGGQLFGRLSKYALQVELATGPYPADLRSRSSYRSHPRAAQEKILTQRKLGLYYCGDWHTHPERYPSASSEDLTTISTVAARSDLRLSCVVMVIQGTEIGPEGLAVYSSNGDVPVKWTIAEKMLEGVCNSENAHRY